MNFKPIIIYTNTGLYGEWTVFLVVEEYHQHIRVSSSGLIPNISSDVFSNTWYHFCRQTKVAQLYREM